MKTSQEIIEKLSLGATIHQDEIPVIDLYMDQVIQLFDAKYGTIFTERRRKSINENNDKQLCKREVIHSCQKQEVFQTAYYVD